MIPRPPPPQVLTSLLWLSAAAVLLPGVGVTAAPSAGWEVVHQQTPKSQGSHSHPSIRYGHSAVPYKGNILSTHGYFYDREEGKATWLSDTWAMSAALPYRWRLLSGHLPQEAAHAAYTQGTIPKAPCGRFGHSVGVAGSYLFLYGGHDGGVSRHNRHNYEPGYDFDELWRFDIIKRTWSFLEPAPGQPTPGKRYLSAMTAIGDVLLLYGGMTESQGDVWAYHTQRDTWTQLAPEVTTASGGPGRRVGHSLLPWADPSGGPKGFLVYGGRTIEPDGNTTLRGDAWLFDLDAKSWRQLQLAEGSIAPPARKYHALMATYLQLPAGVGDGGNAPAAVHVGVAAGGTLTTPALKCAADAWAFTVDCAVKTIAWSRLPDLPVALYDLRGAAWDASAFLFGGHLCVQDDAVRYPFYYVNEVLRLELDPGRVPAEHGCRLPAAKLPPLAVEQLGRRGEDEQEEL